MINKLLTILLFSFFITFNCFTQALPKDLKKYAQLTNQAMLDISENKLTKSTKRFKKAFRFKKLPFPVDLENAIIACIKTKQNNRAIKYAFLLSEYGIDSTFFSHHAKIKSLSFHPQWHRLLELATDNKTKKSQKYAAVKNQIQELIEIDQKFATIRQETFNSDSLANEKFRVISDSLSIQLNEIFRQTGFLTEAMIGLDLNDDFSIKNVPFYNVLIIHNFGGLARIEGNSDTLFKPYLDKALFEGNIMPIYYARTLEWKSDLPQSGKREDNSRFRFGLKSCNLYQCTLYRDYIDEENPFYKSILGNRNKIGLSSLDDFYKLTAANLLKTQSDFNYSAVTAGLRRIGSFADSAYEQSFLKKTLKIATIPNCK